MVVSKNNKCYSKVLRVSSDFDYVLQRYRGNETIKPERKMRVTKF